MKSEQVPHEKYEVDGWRIRVDEEGNFLRTSHSRPKTHYIVTLVKNYAIDVEFLKSEVDNLSEEEKNKTLMDTLRKIVNDITIGKKDQ